MIAREDCYTYIGALRSPDLRHTTKREGDTSVTVVTSKLVIKKNVRSEPTPGKTEIWRDNGEQAAKMGAEVSLCSCDEERELRRRPKQTEATNLTPRHYTGPGFFFFTSALRAWAMAIWDVRAGALSA